MKATALLVPTEAVAVLGKGKRPPIQVSLNGYTYRTTIAVMSEMFMLPLSAANREASGVNAGDKVDITLELDAEPRTVMVPGDLATALSKKRGAKAEFNALSYSVRKEYARQVETAKAQETRARRIAGIVAKLGGS